jgi:hypothetical protein
LRLSVLFLPGGVPSAWMGRICLPGLPPQVHGRAFPGRQQLPSNASPNGYKQTRCQPKKKPGRDGTGPGEKAGRRGESTAEIGLFHLGIVLEFLGRAGGLDLAGVEHIAAVGEIQGHLGVLLD